MKKVQILPLKKISWKNEKDIKKRRISGWFQFRWKSFKNIYQQKAICKNMTAVCTFSTFSHVRQTCFAYNFFYAFFKNFFNGFEIGMKFCFFDTFFDFLQKKNYFSSYLYFFQTLKPHAQKTAQKIIKSISKCVLDLNFAPIKGSCVLNFLKKKSNSLYPNR